MDTNYELDWENFLSEKVCLGAYGMNNFQKSIAIPSTATTTVPAYHVLFTEPKMRRLHDSEKFYLSESEMLTAQLSALLWKRFNGPITMLTDDIGYEYLQGTELFECYDAVLPILDRRNYGINPRKYWASGKIQALDLLKETGVILDMDMLVWKTLDLTDADLIVSHIEHLNERIYPDFSYFIVASDYRFPELWSQQTEPLNTSFLFIRDLEFQKYYTKESIRFMQNEFDTPDTGELCMVFAEQRIIAMCAEEKSIRVKLLLDYDNLDKGNEMITHIWSSKYILEVNPYFKSKYIELCKNKIDELIKLSN